MVIDVVIVDNHGILRDGVRRLLEAQPDMRVVAAAADAHAGIAAVHREKPRLVVMDISMPGMSGIEATKAIVRQSPDTAVLILSVHSVPELIRQAIHAGARGYILKESVGDELIRAIRAVAVGRRYLGVGVAKGVIDWITGEVAGAGALDALTPREREVLRLIAEGKSNAEAAAALALSSRTVETYRYQMMQKLGLPDLSALIRFALRAGLISID